jgi:Lon protease-like protein
MGAGHGSMAEPMRLPFFPLHTVLFPHLPLPLHVFEDRYRQMTRDLLAEGSPYAGRFVVSMITDGPEVVERPGIGSASVTRTRRVGTLAEVHSAEQLPDGRWVLLVVGAARVTLGRIDRAGAYPLVEATQLPEVAGVGAGALVPEAQRALDVYLATVKRFVASAASVERERAGGPDVGRDVEHSLDAVLKPIELPRDPLAASYAVAGVLQVELLRKQQLLELPDAASRLRAELELLRREARLLADGAMPPIGPAELRYNPN